MSGLLKWIGMMILVICLGIWVITVAKTCSKTSDPLLENIIPNDLGASVGEGLSDAKANLDDLYDKGAEEMSDLKKEAIGAKDKIAMKADDLSSNVFEEDPEDIANEEAESERKAIADRRDQLTEKGSSNNNGDSRSNRGSSASTSTGKYFVVTGSFLLETNAKEMMKQLKKAGYQNAEIAVFDLSQYYTVFARRYNTHNSANDLAESISQKLGIETYVHEKRARYQNR